MAEGPVARLQQLESIEKDIATAIQSAGQALQELAKDKPVLKQVETHTTNFMKILMEVEKKLTQQINYLTQVSTGQPHEGSSYAAQKDLTLAYHRMDHIRSRLMDLGKLHIEHQQAQRQLSMTKGPTVTAQMGDGS
ncbi:mediator of RNA polymerase II transcription subunit 11-like [Ylistrum balloti]|uniref:mediator of RNA polymerase II transcription subunit 11-like n=1 Tax=Ylistrum balloti TaxID=509963 RepID=UPI002905C5EB|nr:mediator of RNA polymerase II transcription subunit 11-like [Ylistrum balloti]